MPILISFIAGISTVIGSIFIFVNINKKNINKFISYCLSLSLAIMILISITELIPVSLKNIMIFYKFPLSILLVCIIPIIGYNGIKLIDKISSSTNNLYKLGIINMIVLILHNMPEGIITYLSSIENTSLGVKLCIAIMLHNIPEGIAIAIPIYYGTGSKTKAVGMSLISGLSEPLGAVLTHIFFKNIITAKSLSIILLFVGAIMITLSINKLYPEASKLGENKYVYFGLISGIILITIIETFF
ncbi:MAG: ZIP family metal transporter [Bacilli bacterium]